MSLLLRTGARANLYNEDLGLAPVHVAVQVERFTCLLFFITLSSVIAIRNIAIVAVVALFLLLRAIAKSKRIVIAIAEFFLVAQILFSVAVVR